MRQSRNFYWLLVVTMVCGFLVGTSGSAQDSQLQDEAPEAAGPNRTPAGETDRYLVTFMRSTTTNLTGGSVNVATVLSVTNLGNQSCNVSVQFFRAFSTTAECTVTLNTTAQQNRTFCSRNVSADDFSICTATCSPELDFHDGRAIVSSTSGTACSRLGVSASVFYTNSTDSSVLGVGDPTAVRLD